MTRVLSAAVLLPILFVTVWYLPPVATFALAAIAAGLATHEYTGIAAGLGVHVPQAVSVVGVVAACAAIGLGALPLDLVLLTALLALGAIAVGRGHPGPGVLADVAAGAFPVLYIGLPLGALVALRAGSREAIALLAVVIIVSDSAQYYTGRALGRRPLAPAISPKKTIEGALGGIVIGGAAMAAGGRVLFPDASLAVLVLMSLTVAAAGIVGDLFESLLKRSAGVKDSSSLIPGHGGVLDRIDSWLFAGPVFYVFARYLQI
jgi:phosphatidate cytidylyltransferase